MVVVHVVEAFGGGVYSYLKDLCTFSSKLTDIKTVIIYSSKRKEIDVNKVDIISNANIELLNIDMERSIDPIKDAKSIFKLRAALKLIKPDIVHLHSSKAGILGRVACFGIINSNQVFYSPHGYSFLSHEFSSSKKKLFYYIEKIAQKIFGGTTVACGDTEFEIASKIGKSVLVRNGIVPSRLEKYQKDISNERLKIGTLGRISLQKNPSLFNQIAQKYPEYDFVWIGDGELKQHLTSKNIDVTGWTTDFDLVMQHLSTLDVYMQTSSWEGLPIAIIEAMALKKPVVATNIIGNKDVVAHGKTGYLFNEIDELDTIFSLLEDNDCRNTLGTSGYKRCISLFNSDTNFNQLLSIYFSKQ